MEPPIQYFNISRFVKILSHVIVFRNITFFRTANALLIYVMATARPLISNEIPCIIYIKFKAALRIAPRKKMSINHHVSLVFLIKTCPDIDCNNLYPLLKKMKLNHKTIELTFI